MRENLHPQTRLMGRFCLLPGMKSFCVGEFMARSRSLAIDYHWSTMTTGIGVIIIVFPQIIYMYLNLCADNDSPDYSVRVIYS